MRGLPDDEESLRKEKCCYRLHLLGKITAGEKGTDQEVVVAGHALKYPKDPQ